MQPPAYSDRDDRYTDRYLLSGDASEDRYMVAGFDGYSTSAPIGRYDDRAVDAYATVLEEAVDGLAAVAALLSYDGSYEPRYGS